MKIALIDNPIHKRSQSFSVIDEIFRDLAIVKFYDNTWKDALIKTKFDLVLFFQEFPNLKEKTLLLGQNVVIVPMWDACRKMRADQWLDYRDYRFLCFSKKLKTRLSNLGLETIYSQFMPSLSYKKREHDKTSVLKVFFWQRVAQINLNRIAKIIPNNLQVEIFFRSDVEEIHLTSKENPNWTLKKIPWFDTKDDLWKFLTDIDLFVAPRLYEGIGLSYLEAMALGLAVVAYNGETMNEYIIDDATGYLTQFHKVLNLNSIREVGNRALELSEAIRKKWVSDLPIIKNWLLSKTSKQNSVPFWYYPSLAISIVKQIIRKI